MFYDGDLQAGIALAVRNAKSVICFIRDDGEESSAWENEYLADQAISQLVTSKAVPLRLDAGSQEASFLAPFCPIDKVPTLVVIKNGVVKAHLVPGISEEDFKQQLKAALEEEESTGAQVPRQEEMDEGGAATPSPAVSVPTPTTSTSSEVPENNSASSTDQARRESIRAGKRPATNDTPEPEEETDATAHRISWQAQQRKREQKQKEERERVLHQIRQDNEARKQREESRRAATMSRKIAESQNNTSSPAEQTHPKPSPTQQYRLQVRLFDGTSVRSTFAPSKTIRHDVRPWLDSQRSDGDSPYNLKHIISPLPHRTISVAEEDQTLEELDLGPTASLVMVPVRTYTEAYASSGSSLPVRGLYYGYNLVTGTVGAVAGAVGSFLGLGQGAAAGGNDSSTPATGDTEPEPAPRSSAPRASRNRNARPNIRTLFDGADDERDAQFYNGNQLNFEPRKDQDSDK
ncbi:hypothetical protein AJ80_01657 [Polytolypa hystricis UAMH7299]|uniref:UBX domain-containing protein 2 n=1 Tax=Polytolypa hystricis (strain UAMH7299) TaxID=1447883 RepID=A0A2B7Z068_POLH7|nr:hypothetical protein AJ80_01657 [Polytolypa hystricis UAMH7299]